MGKTDKPGFWTLPALPRKNGPASDEGGHAVLAIGFDDKGKRILCQNSWGESVDGAPLFYIGYDWIKDFEATSDFWMVRLVEKKEKQKPNARESRLRLKQDRQGTKDERKMEYVEASLLC